MIQPNEDNAPDQGENREGDLQACLVQVMIREYVDDYFQVEGTISGTHWFVVGQNPEGLIIVSVSPSPMCRDDFYQKWAKDFYNWRTFSRKIKPTGDQEKDMRACISALTCYISEFADDIGIESETL